jgi:hypothetical protein
VSIDQGSSGARGSRRAHDGFGWQRGCSFGVGVSHGDNRQAGLMMAGPFNGSAEKLTYGVRRLYTGEPKLQVRGSGAWRKLQPVDRRDDLRDRTYVTQGNAEFLDRRDSRGHLGERSR